MPIYLLKKNLIKGETVILRRTLQGLNNIEQDKIDILLNKGAITVLETPEWAYFDALAGYDILMDELNVETLGDFAGLNPDDIPPELKDIQVEVLDLLNPYTPSELKDCCGD